jgi:predicted RNA-binding protein YlxR (DUF448 family)
MAEPGEEDEETGPLRRCLVTGRTRAKEELIRFVASPEGDVVPDLDNRLPGRGMWLSPGRDVVHTAGAKGLFSKSARRKLQASADLAQRVEAQLLRRCLDLLGLARRAGQAVAGFEKVKAMLANGQAALLLEASDGAMDGRRKLLGAAREKAPHVIVLFAAQDLGQAMGRETAVHVAVAPGGLAGKLAREASRYAEWLGAGVPAARE